MKQKKIVNFILSTLNGGGAENVCVKLCNEFVLKKYTVNLFVLNIENQKYLDRLNNDVNLISLNVAHSKSSFFKLNKYICSVNDSLFFVFSYEMFVVASLISYFKKNVKLVFRNVNSITMKNKTSSSLKEKILLRYLLPVLLKRADLIVNQCKAMQEDLISVVPSCADSSIVIYNPSIVNDDVKKFTNFEFFDVFSDNYFLCVGRLENQKNFSDAIKAFYLFSKKHSNYRLVFAGEGSKLNFLKECVDEYGLTHKVHFIGFNDNLSCLYKNATATLLTSNYEGFPNVLVESISCGTPVISYDCMSGPSEIIINSMNGYLVANKDVNAFATKMNLLICKPIDKYNVLESSRKFSMSCVFKNYEELLNRVNVR